MVKFAQWASGSVGLSNGGDEVLLLDASNTLINVDTFGTGPPTS